MVTLGGSPGGELLGTDGSIPSTKGMVLLAKPSSEEKVLLEEDGTEASSEEVTQPTLRAKHGPGKSASTLSAPRTLEEGMNGPSGTPSAPLEEALEKPPSSTPSAPLKEALEKPVNRWDDICDDFYHQILPEGSQAGNFDLTIPEEAMTLGLWGGQKVVSLEKWFNKEALDKLAEVRRGLKADAKAKNPMKYRNESNVRKSNLEFLCIPNGFADEIQARVEKAADIVLGQVNKG